MANPVKRAFKFRFHPTDEQAGQLARTFGCVRLVYNMALKARTEAWALEGRRISYAETSAALTAWKKTEDLAFLNEVSSVPLQQALRHLQTGFSNFYAKRSGYPRFKSRKNSRASAERRAGAAGGFGSRDRRRADLAADSLSSGEKIANPRHERRDRERLAGAQRELARKQRGSANREKARIRVARVHARIADRRRDHLHKLTTRLVRENQTIVIEDLSVRDLVSDHTLAKAISDAAWNEMRIQLEYKCAWYGRELIAVDRYYPSTRLCSVCGAIREKLPLNVREWRCRCGAVHDRDVNAARNILAAGLAASACGAGVRPQRRTPDGQPARKQETRGATRGLPAR